MIQWDDEWRVLTADSLEEARGIAHPSGPRQVGVWEGDDLLVYTVSVDGEELTHHPDHWGVPGWHPEEV